jgi:hypothetical protein
VAVAAGRSRRRRAGAERARFAPQPHVSRPHCAGCGAGGDDDASVRWWSCETSSTPSSSAIVSERAAKAKAGNACGDRGNV